MSDRYKVRKRQSNAAPVPRQKTIAFESRLTRGLTGQERMKVVRSWPTY